MLDFTLEKEIVKERHRFNVIKNLLTDISFHLFNLTNRLEKQ